MAVFKSLELFFSIVKQYNFPRKFETVKQLYILILKKYLQIPY